MIPRTLRIPADDMQAVPIGRIDQIIRALNEWHPYVRWDFEIEGAHRFIVMSAWPLVHRLIERKRSDAGEQALVSPARRRGAKHLFHKAYFDEDEMARVCQQTGLECVDELDMFWVCKEASP